MGFFKSAAVLALATGFAAATPVKAPRAPEELPAYKATPVKRDQFGNGISNNNNFNFFDQFNNVNRFNQDQVFQFQQEQLLIQDNGVQQLVVDQVKQVLVIDNNRGRRGFNNLARKSNFRNNFRDQSTVMIVVQEIQVSVDDGRGNVFQKQVFAQSIDVANRGRRQTQTVALFESEVLVATQVINGNRNNGFGGGIGFAQPTGVAFSNSSNSNNIAGIQLFGNRPSFSNVVNDPATEIAAAWQAELLDAGDSNALLQNNQLADAIFAAGRN